MKKPARRQGGEPDDAREILTYQVLPEVPEYARRWHEVDDWAYQACANLGDIEEFHTRNPRLAGFRGMWVNDMDDNEEAFDKGIPLQRTIDVIPRGPKKERGGYRRISIRLHTWVLDQKYGGAYNPQWITTGSGFTGEAATTKHYRYLDDYAYKVSKHLESRRLLVTAMEIIFWTTKDRVDYL